MRCTLCWMTILHNSSATVCYLELPILSHRIILHRSITSHYIVSYTMASTGYEVEVKSLPFCHVTPRFDMLPHGSSSIQSSCSVLYACITALVRSPWHTVETLFLYLFLISRSLPLNRLSSILRRCSLIFSALQCSTEEQSPCLAVSKRSMFSWATPRTWTWAQCGLRIGDNKEGTQTRDSKYLRGAAMHEIILHFNSR